MTSRITRWIPAAAAPIVIAGVVAVPVAAASAAPQLPSKTPAQVLALVAQAKDLVGFSGTVSQHSDLGLPSIPSTGAGSDSSTGSALQDLTGDHTARVWSEGATKSRIAVLDSTAETDVVRNGSTVWTWDSDHQKATETTLTGATAPAPHASTLTPQQAADELLQQVGPTTATTVDRTQRVAGRDAYTLKLTPKTDATTVGSVSIAVDAATGLPLSVQVVPRGATAAAVSVAFTSVDPTAPAASTFDFTPPKGATVTKRTVDASDAKARAQADAASASRPTVVGSGWSAVVESSGVPADVASDATVQRLTTTVSGGRVLRTSLVNVLLTDDGRVLAGAVPVSRLTDLAG